MKKQKPQHRIPWWCFDVPYDKPQKNKVFFLNLFFYGIGDEYKIDPNELENSKRTCQKHLRKVLLRKN